MLDITVCILSYNRAAYLREAVESVLAQTKQPEKIIIYDNGSSENVFEKIKDLLDRGVQWVDAEVNHPFIWNFNRAMQNSATRYTLIMHDDDRLCPNFLEMQTQLLDSDLSIAAASCNGYFIDENGNRTGATLASTVGDAPVEFYTCGGQVALKYAANSCIPFSPTVYRTEVGRSVKFREEFGKVCDAVYFCDLAEIGPIAYQISPLYESRLHAGQDSSHFPYDLMNQLEEYFWSRRCVNDAEKATLHHLLVKQHTARNIKQLLHSAIKGNLSRAVSLLMDDKFRFADAVKVIGDWGIKRIFAKFKLLISRPAKKLSQGAASSRRNE